MPSDLTDDELKRLALRLAKDPAFDACLDNLVGLYTVEWTASDPADAESRERSYRALHGVLRVRQQIRAWAGLPDT